MKKFRAFTCSALLLSALLAVTPSVVQARGIVSGRAFDSYRLPNTTVPTHYTLRLDTDIHREIFDYTGNVQIRINVLEATDQIVLHSSRSEITHVQLRNGVGLNVTVKNFELDDDKEFLVVNVGTTLQPNTGTYTLEIDFTNSIARNDQAGFYRSSYDDENGVRRYLGLTQFESVDARTSFPCYDEPGIKTTYDILIVCGIDYHARSNAPLRGIQLLEGGKKLSTFATTPRMQTYLVAWLVSDFKYEREVLTDPQLAIASWSKPSSVHLLSYSVDASKRFMRAMEEYFDQLYSMSKIDNVAIKDEDYAAGAMENWGLVTYKESAISYGPEDGEQRQVGVVTIVGHEFTHQFFGNLLAPKWWSYLWLNEGFARLYQYYLGAIDEVVSFNPHSTGYYRVEYEENMLRELIERINKDHTGFEPATRARLIDDTLNIAQSRGGNYDVVLQLLNYLQRETDYVPWAVAYENLRHMQGMLRKNEAVSQLLERFIEKIASPLLERYGVDHRTGESAAVEELRTIAIDLACSGSQSCKDDAQSAVRSLASKKHYTMEDNALLCHGLQHSNAEQRKALQAQFSQALNDKNLDNPSAKQLLLQSLSCLGEDMTKVQSFAKYLLALSESDRTKALHRLLVELNVPLAEIVQSLQSELSQRRRYVSHHE
uniref:Aminopeptidase n=1 Tax=Anopheles merus TaxID=30066 RepID=A0A182VK77_ANOME